MSLVEMAWIKFGFGSACWEGEISAPPLFWEGIHNCCVLLSRFLASCCRGLLLLHVMKTGGVVFATGWLTSVVWFVRMGGWNFVRSRVACGDIGCGGTGLFVRSRDALWSKAISRCSPWSMSSAFERCLVSSYRYFRILKVPCKDRIIGSSDNAYEDAHGPVALLDM